MQKLVVAPLFLATFVLAGCSASNSSGGNSSTTGAASATSQAGMPAPAATAITGTVKLENAETEVLPDAKLELSLVDVSKQPSVTVNKQDFAPPKFPQAFHIPFSASAINPGDLYILQAELQNNNRVYHTKLEQPVLTRGQSANVNLTLVPEPTPAEKMLDAFNQAKRQTGGMTVKSGTSSKIGESQSWQVFSDAQGIEFIIEQVNQADKGFTKTEYAYRNSLPWVTVQEQMPKADAPPSTTERAGWDDSGKLVLNQKISDGKTGTLSDAEAKSLHDQAEAAYKRFGKKKH